DLRAFIDPADKLGGAFDVRRVGERDDDAVALGTHGAADAGLAKLGPDVRLVRREELLHRSADVDLVQEVHTAPQVEAERHRLQPERSKKRRRARRERQRDDVVRQRSTKHVVRPELGLDHRETHEGGVVLDRRGEIFDPRVSKGAFNLLDGGGGDRRTVRLRYMQRWIVAEEVRQGEDHARHADHEHEDVDPSRIPVHRRLLARWFNGFPRATCVRGASPRFGCAQTLLNVPFGTTAAIVFFWTFIVTLSANSTVTY